MANYGEFVVKLATYKALDDALRTFGNLNWLMELYYEYNEIDKLKLSYFKDVKKHPDYIRLTNQKYPNLKTIDPDQDIDLDDMRNISSKVDTALDTKQATINLSNISPTLDTNDFKQIDDKINLFSTDEKILILSFLNSLSTKSRIEIPDTEIVRIHVICEGIFTKDIFLQESNSLNYMRKFSKGIHYYPKRNKQIELQNSISLKLDQLPLPKFKKIYEQNI